MQASAFKPDLLMTAVFKNIVAVRLDFIVGSIVTMAVIAASPSSSLHRRRWLEGQEHEGLQASV
jgi:hypothetical protein